MKISQSDQTITPVIAGLAVGIAFVILFALFSGFTFLPFQTDYESAVIMLERTSCYGNCPDYSLTIYGNGTVLYEGRQFVAVVGNHTSSIPVEKIRTLINYFGSVGFLSMEDNYGRGFDIPTYTTSIRIGEMTKTVVHNSMNGPHRLFLLDNRIDSIADSYKWLNCPVGETVASSDAGGCRVISR